MLLLEAELAKGNEGTTSNARGYDDGGCNGANTIPDTEQPGVTGIVQRRDGVNTADNKLGGYHPP